MQQKCASNVIDDLVEFHLSQPVNITNTTFIRSSLEQRAKEDGHDHPPVELMRFHVFIHCTGGSGRHMVDFEQHELRRGTVIWIRPGQVQQWSRSDDFDADVAVFESSSITDLPLFDHLPGTTRIAHVGDDSVRLQQQMDWIAGDLAASQDHAIAAAAVSVILRLFARHTDQGDRSLDVSRRRLAIDFAQSIESNIQQRSVSWHAEQIGSSPRSIARSTAEILGQRPKEVVDMKVGLEARRRLAWSSDDIGTISRDLGFYDQSNFTKFFRKHTGLSPSAFRESVVQLESESAATQLVEAPNE